MEIGQKLLLVDDEADIVQMLKDNFEMQGYEVLTAYGAKEAAEKLSKKPDLILLDIGMPDMDGIDFCKQVRKFVSAPIIFLSAKIEEQDKIRGLMAGGDDYITKPFSIEELNVRVMAHLRRELRQTESHVYFAGKFALQFEERKLFFEKQEIKLTKTEFNIMELLCMNKGRIFDKESIYEHLWGFDKEGDSAIITEHVRRIREKCRKFSDQELIQTVWGVGYQWIG